MRTVVLFFFFLVLRFSNIYQLTFVFCRDELEADHLGMMLMAAAGSDSRYAPIVRLPHGLYHRDEDVFSTRPSSERRAKMLVKDIVVKQAMDIYEKVKAGEGFTFFN